MPSNTWPVSISDASGASALANINLDANLDSTFDFSADSNMDITYDPNSTLDNFDTSTFNFDPAAEDFVPGAATQDIWQSWAGKPTGGFDDSQSFAETMYNTTSSAAVDGQNGGYGEYGVFDPQMYGSAEESQAYGGAGPDADKEDVLTVVEAAPAVDSQTVMVEEQPALGLEGQDGEV